MNQNTFLKCLVDIFLFCCVADASADEVRTWSDASGRFKIEAKLVSQKDGKVKLERTDGKTIEIELAKLSEADQKYIKELKNNPFKAATSDNPFMPAKDGKQGASASGASPSRASAAIDWSQSKLVDISTYGDGWDFEVPGGGELDFVPKAVQLPKRVDFFEGMKQLAINPHSRKAVAGYLWTFGLKNKGPQTRLVMCDLEKGRVMGEATVGAEMVPLALHPDGQHILMKSAARNQHGLEIWSMQGNKIVRERTLEPYQEEWKVSKDVQWAQFASEDRLVLKHGNGWVTIWDFRTLQPVCHFEIEKYCTPALSANGKTLAFYHKERIGLFDVETHEVVAIQKAPRHLSFVNFAWSPSEKRLACVAHTSLLVWDAETGEIYRDFTPPGIVIHGVPRFSNDEFILLGNRYLVELENMIKLWDYEGADQVRAIGGTTFFAITPQKSTGALMPRLIPHDAAKDALDAALNDPDLFVFRKGVTVRVDTSGIPASHKAKVEASLRNKLDAMDIQVSPSASLTVKASISAPKQQQMRYFGRGTFTVQIHGTLVEIIFEGKVIWKASGTNIPHFVSLKHDENLGDILREKSRQPDYDFYQSVALPKFAQKSTGDLQPGQAHRQTIGVSKVVPTTKSPRRPSGRRR